LKGIWQSFCRGKRLAAAALLLTAATSAQAKHPYGVFPESEQAFRRLIADPRHIQLGVSYYRLQGRDSSDVALGHSWGMARWYSHEDYWMWQWNLEAMAYSRFTVGGSVNRFETVDFLANLPISVRHDGFSAKGMLFHDSSHLGDDYIRRTGDTGFRYSVEGARVIASYEPQPWARVYGGATYLLHTIPSPARWTLQSGFELTSKDLELSRKYPVRVFLAQDLQSRENVQWNLNSRSMLGVTLGFHDVPRYMRIYVGYFDGHSPYGQFFARREHYADLGVSLHF
jgi:hypothetical protein